MSGVSVAAWPDDSIFWWRIGGSSNDWAIFPTLSHTFYPLLPSSIMLPTYLPPRWCLARIRCVVKGESSMPGNHNDIEKRLWDAADQLRANSRLKSFEYAVPVLGLIFLRYADYKFGSQVWSRHVPRQMRTCLSARIRLILRRGARCVC